jgi:hypothetical protein
MSTDGGHLGWSFGSLDIILKVDHLRTIHAMFALNWLTEKNVLKSSPLKPVSQYSKHVIGGQLPKLCSVIPISVQNGHRQQT